MVAAAFFNADREEGGREASSLKEDAAPTFLRAGTTVPFSFEVPAATRSMNG